MSGINCIYHTARCGSTLLAALLSSVGPAFAEPGWATDYWMRGQPIPSSREGAIIKLPSLAIFHAVLPGRHVFLYRPLAQHLFKYKCLEADWLWQRHAAIEQYIADIDCNGVTQSFAAAWARQVELALRADCMMVPSNRLFDDPAEVAGDVIAFFGLKGQPDLRFAEIDAKAAKLIGQGDPICFPTRSSVAIPGKGHGLIATESAMQDDLIRSAVEWVEDHFSAARPFTR